MKYRNTRTGAEFETPCECAGDDWERVEVKSAPSQSIQKPEKPARAPVKRGVKAK